MTGAVDARARRAGIPGGSVLALARAARRGERAERRKRRVLRRAFRLRAEPEQ